MISITTLTPSDHSDYEDFISRNPNARYAHDLNWAEALRHTYGFRKEHLIAREGNRVVGVLPLFFSCSWVQGKHYSTSPFPSYAAPLYESQGALNALLNAVAEKTDKTDYTFLYTGKALPKTSISHQLSLCCDNLTFCLSLNTDPDKVFAKLSKNVQRNIHHTEKKEIEIVVDSQGTFQEEFYQLYSSIYAKKHGLPPHPRCLFSNLWRHIPSNGLRVYLARYKGRFIASIMTFRAHGEVYYAWAASESSANALQPTTALIWKAIQDGCIEGFRVFNMGEAPKEHKSLILFKTRWCCSEIRETHSYYLLGRATKPPISFYDGFGWQKKIITRLPLFITTRFLSHFLRFIL